jgi:ABC-2 type transport system ATP-binding protein
MIVEVKNLKKLYRLKKAVDNISLTVHKGSVFGLIGPNGAGKSTTINLLSGISEASSGVINLFGERFYPSSLRIKRRIGVLPEVPALFSNLKVNEQLYFSGRIYGLDKRTLNRRIGESLDYFNLAEDQNKFIYELSAGMKKTLAFICSIIHGPELLFLDEPFERVDPMISKVLRGIIRQLKDSGRTVILTSHHLMLIEELCTHIALMEKGKFLVIAETAEILKKIADNGEQGGQPLLEEFYLDFLLPQRKEISLSWLQEKGGFRSGTDMKI